MNTNDTIAAICTGTGGAIAVIRISGAAAGEIGNRVWHGRHPLERSRARLMMLGTAQFAGRGGDLALAVYMPGPNSYTGEDIVEIQCHGGNLTAGKVLEATLKAGARMAAPGEFTYRAFINGKMDLTQAEAVADIINAGSNMALLLAERQNAGILGRRLGALRQQLIGILAESESRLDFTEEDLDWTPGEETATALRAIHHELQLILASRQEGAVLRNGIRVVIAGRPNAGKSSLLNWLLGFDRAIVTAIPGTTRDTLEETAHLRGIPVHLTDTAGLREADNLIENLGIDRSRKSLSCAEVVLWVLDASSVPEAEVSEMHRRRPDTTPTIAIWNKLDLIVPDHPLPETNLPTVGISVVQQTGMTDLLDE
ncbi:MAG: tRNA uridine-5-carboxymethylaminomethyl(34) synthesis GTPase MnmE, partial [Victivallales bacterium]|nr:tRNA uridine-5-carboxymethylaminomethyl(34) synthesis GTPase MnmE [Victivallales bacterium]